MFLMFLGSGSDVPAHEECEGFIGCLVAVRTAFFSGPAQERFLHRTVFLDDQGGKSSCLSPHFGHPNELKYRTSRHFFSHTYRNIYVITN